MIRRLSPGLFLCAVLAGCGGGGGGSAVPQAQPSSVTPKAKQRIAVSITVPGASNTAAALKRRPLYVSIATQSATIAVNGGAPVVASLAANAPNCKPAPGGGRICTIVVDAPVGTDTFTEATFASIDGTGTPLSTTTSLNPVVSGVANVINLVLGGVVSSIQLSISNPNPPIGTVVQLPLTVTFQDASNYTIIGNDQFATPITITDSDATHTSVSKTPLNSPADAYGLVFNYDGKPLLNGPAVLGASATGVPASKVIGVTVTPQSPTTVSFVDWPTYGYDSQRSGFNPFSTAITPASVSQLHLAWQLLGIGATQTQPIVITNIVDTKGIFHSALLIIGNFAIVQAYDALTGALVWQNTLPTQGVQDCGYAGVSGTMQYVRSINGGSIFVAAGSSAGSDPNHTVLYRLDAASGTTTQQVDIMPTTLPGEANYSHTGITYANGRIYLGTGSDCEGTATGNPSWRGRVVSVDPTSMALLSTFFTTYGQGPNGETYGGGGVWAWGGVSADQIGNVYVAAGNAENLDATGKRPILPPFVAAPNEWAGYAEHLVKLNADLSFEGSTQPVFDFSNGGDLDYTGTPIVFSTSDCGTVTATQGKAGTLVMNNAQTLNQLNSFAFSVPNSEANYMGNPAYWPKTLLSGTGYVYAAVSSSGGGSLGIPPGLAAVDACNGSYGWKAAFGPDSSAYGANGAAPRSAPTVTAGGVVFMGTPCTATGLGGTGCAATGVSGGALWAVDATTGAVLGNSLPILHTPDMIRMAPTVDGQWVYVLDSSGNFYGLTTDATVPAIAAKVGRKVPPTFRIRRR